MENLTSLVNKIQRACTALGDHGDESALPSLWDSLPSIAVVGGQVSSFSHLLLWICLLICLVAQKQKESIESANRVILGSV